MLLRNRETGDIITHDSFRSLNSTTSFPEVLSVDILSDFGYDPVLEGAQPTVTENQYVRSAGVEQDTKGNWVTKYEAVDFSPEEIAASQEQKRQSMIVSPFQAKAALLQAGLLTQVEALINDPASDPLVKLAWNNALEYKRLSSTIVSLAEQLNLSDEQLDELFTNAANITA